MVANSSSEERTRRQREVWLSGAAVIGGPLLAVGTFEIEQVAFIAIPVGLMMFLGGCLVLFLGAPGDD